MLVLTRYKGENLIVKDETTGKEMLIQIANVEGNKVRLAIDAPNEVTVVREEIA